MLAAKASDTDEGNRRGRAGAKTIHGNLSTRHPGRPRKPACAAKPA